MNRFLASEILLRAYMNLKLIRKFGKYSSHIILSRKEIEKYNFDKYLVKITYDNNKIVITKIGKMKVTDKNPDDKE